MSKPEKSLPIAKAADSPEAEIKIYTPRSFSSAYREIGIPDGAPVRIYERPSKTDLPLFPQN